MDGQPREEAAHKLWRRGDGCTRGEGGEGGKGVGGCTGTRRRIYWAKEEYIRGEGERGGQRGVKGGGGGGG